MIRTAFVFLALASASAYANADLLKYDCRVAHSADARPADGLLNISSDRFADFFPEAQRYEGGVTFGPDGQGGMKFGDTEIALRWDGSATDEISFLTVALTHDFKTEPPQVRNWLEERYTTALKHGKGEITSFTFTSSGDSFALLCTLYP